MFKKALYLLAVSSFAFASCGGPTGNNGNKSAGALGGSAAEKAYVAPGEYDEFYN